MIGIGIAGTQVEVTIGLAGTVQGWCWSRVEAGVLRLRNLVVLHQLDICLGINMEGSLRLEALAKCRDRRGWGLWMEGLEHWDDMHMRD